MAYIVNPRGDLGLKTFSLINVGSGLDANNIQNQPCSIYGLDIMNNGASVIYLKIYNTSVTPTNVMTPVRRYMIPAGGGVVRVFHNGLPMSAGLGIILSAGIADNDNTNVPASVAVINVDYF